MIVAVPLPTAVTSPEPSTVATASSLDSQENCAPTTACPFASVASATSRTVSPNATSVSTAGVTATALTSWATVTAAVPETDPAVAEIVVFPFATAVTSPEASTVATEASPLAHATAAPAITCPFWSRTSAVSCTVAPSATIWAVAGLTVTAVARGGSRGGGSVPPSPHAETHTAIASPVATPAMSRSRVPCFRRNRILRPS